MHLAIMVLKHLKSKDLVGDTYKNIARSIDTDYESVKECCVRLRRRGFIKSENISGYLQRRVHFITSNGAIYLKTHG